MFEVTLTAHPSPRIDQANFLLLILGLILAALLLSASIHRPANVRARELCEDFARRAAGDWVWDGEGCR